VRRTYLIAAVSLLLSALILAHSQTSRRTTQTPQTRATAQPLTIDRVVSTQQRINRYFHGDVMPRLQKCWSTVRGQGTIAFEYTYIEAKGRWLFSRLQTQESTLANGQDSLALKCMLNAVGGTSFPTDVSEGSGNTFVLNWKWPVPLPANAGELASKMFAIRVSNGAGETDDCDGSGTHPKCYTCTLEHACKKVCVGGAKCILDSNNPQSPCAAQGYCASGGPFGIIAITSGVPQLRRQP